MSQVRKIQPHHHNPAPHAPAPRLAPQTSVAANRLGGAHTAPHGGSSAPAATTLAGAATHAAGQVASRAAATTSEPQSHGAQAASATAHLSALAGWSQGLASANPSGAHGDAQTSIGAAKGADAITTHKPQATGPAAGSAPAGAANPIDQIPTSLLPNGQSHFDFQAKLGRLTVARGDGDIKREDGKISITARPRGEDERRSTLEPDPDRPGNVLMTRNTGEKFSGKMKVTDEGGIHFSDGRGHSLSMDPNRQGGFDMTTTGFGIESRATTVIANIKKQQEEP